MIVGKRMSSPVVTIPSSVPLPDAMNLMRQEKIRHLVVIEKSKMVGLITQSDLEGALPSKATSLSIWEINYLVDRIKVADVMVKDVITATEDMPVEEAARIMADNKITCLPVLRGNDVVGIITETDLFRLFLELFGARQKGVRLSAEVSSEPGTLAKISEAIFELGGDIIAIGSFAGDAVSSNEITMKVQGVDENQLKEAIQPLIIRLTSICTMC